MEVPNLSPCPQCNGRGQQRRRLRKRARLRYQAALAAFESAGGAGAPPPERPKGELYTCPQCGGTGLARGENPLPADAQTFPQVAIIGGGIGGVALAVALLHRGIPFTLYEQDSGFEVRSQGYGLTLQQGGKAVAGLGISDLAAGVVSTRHVVHTPAGKIVGEWGMRKWQHKEATTFARRTNVHIARQALRLALLNQLGSNENIQWGHRLTHSETCKEGGMALLFEVGGAVKEAQADLVVGADGIWSAVRKLFLDETQSPLRYLGCMVILGICPLSALGGTQSELLDSATVFQTANGHERMYAMPYAADSLMWQFSFPIGETEAKALSAKGPEALLEETRRRTPDWHIPVPQMVAATEAMLVSGYPVYDRQPLEGEQFARWGAVTLIGDAAHPMSPFKGQGANQALLDALALARGIYEGCRQGTHWRVAGIREAVLGNFEEEMLVRSAAKVEDSAAAAGFLHSDVVLYEGNEPRGRCLKRGKE